MPALHAKIYRGDIDLRTVQIKVDHPCFEFIVSSMVNLQAQSSGDTKLQNSQENREHSETKT